MKDTPTKEIITRAAVEQQLHKQNQTEIRSLSILFFILCVLCLLMAALMNSASAQLGHWLILRIGYMVLPKHLVKVYKEKLGFYSCTVPTFMQYVLTELIDNGDFERHINRVRRQERREK